MSRSSACATSSFNPCAPMASTPRRWSGKAAFGALGHVYTAIQSQNANGITAAQTAAAARRTRSRNASLPQRLTAHVSWPDGEDARPAMNSRRRDFCHFPGRCKASQLCELSSFIAPDAIDTGSFPWFIGLALRRRQEIAAERPKIPVALAGARTAQQVAARNG